MKLVLIIAIAAFLLLLLTELFLRWRYGFGNPLTYEADNEIGYLLSPNQETRRFGNRIRINQYSMRSDDITPQRPDRTLRILIVGDSVANGGWWTDQSNTISTMLREMVQTAQLKSQFSSIEVLNASANSWSPRSEVAYLKRFGLFESQMLVLIINTDDLFATAPTPLIVGNDRNYPKTQPIGAIGELLQRYLLPAPKLPAEVQAIQSEGGDRVGKVLEAIRQISAIAQAGNAKFLLVMTPLLREVEQSPRDYEIDARTRLLTFTKEQNIEYVDSLASFKATQPTQNLYHDHIHLNAAGNRLISDQIQKWIDRMEK
jgi:hypothetical protein